MPRSSPRTSSDTIEMTAGRRGDGVPDLARARRSRRRPHRGRAVPPSVAEAGHQASLRAGRACAAAARRRRQQRSLGRPEAVGVEPGPPVALAEELRPGQDRDHRLGEQEDHDDVDQGREPEGEREARARCRPTGRRGRPRRGTTRSRRPGSCAGRGPSRSRRRPAGVLPSRTSSRSRSKKTTNESAVMPMATIRSGDTGEAQREADLPAEQHDQAVGQDAGRPRAGAR